MGDFLAALYIICHAQAVRQSCWKAGTEFPAVIEGSLWDEFNTDRLHRSASLYLCREDKLFQIELEELQHKINKGERNIRCCHRCCDIAVVAAGVKQGFLCSEEFWNMFRRCTLSSNGGLCGVEPGSKIAVATSATSIGIWVAQVFQLSKCNTWRTASVAFNPSVTTLQVSHEETRLFTFTGVPHLAEPEQRSFR